MNAYAQAGVDVSVEAKASRIMYEASRKTFANRTGRIGEIIVPFDDFSGLKMIQVEQLPRGSCMSLGFDGAGTKVELAGRMRIYNTIAHDVIAMVCDDAILRGGEPVLVGSVLDIKTLGSDERYLRVVQQLADGYVSAAKEANVAIINGEIAQLGACISGYGDFPFNWSAGCIWFAQRQRLLTGHHVKPGHAIVMLRENGFRANGLSLVRKVFSTTFGGEWHTQPFGLDTLGAQVLTPSTIYSRLITRLNGGFEDTPLCEISGIAHITGGGIPEKLGRALRPSGCGASLINLWNPPLIMMECQERGKITDYDAYQTWNMGQGMAVITPDPETVIHEALAMGFEAKISGVVTKEKDIRLTSRGLSQDEVLSFGE